MAIEITKSKGDRYPQVFSREFCYGFYLFCGRIELMKKKVQQFLLVSGTLGLAVFMGFTGVFQSAFASSTLHFVTGAILPAPVIVQLADLDLSITDVNNFIPNTKLRINGNAILSDTATFEDLRVQSEVIVDEEEIPDSPLANFNVGYPSMANTPNFARMQVNGPIKVTSLNEADGLQHCVCADSTGTMRTCGVYNPALGQHCLPQASSSGSGTIDPTYTWQPGPWGSACTSVTRTYYNWVFNENQTITENVRTRTLTCIDNNLQTVADSFCNADERVLLGETTTEGCTQPNSGGTGGKIICGELYRQGYLSEELWQADNQYADEHVSDETIALYHKWAQPIVNLMSRSAVATEIVKPYGLAWAQHMAYLQGATTENSFLGAALHNTFLPLHDMIAGGDSSTSPEHTMPQASFHGIVLFVALIVFVVGLIAILLSPVVILLAYLSSKKPGVQKTLRWYRCAILLMIITLILAYLL